MVTWPPSWAIRVYIGLTSETHLAVSLEVSKWKFWNAIYCWQTHNMRLHLLNPFADNPCYLWCSTLQAQSKARRKFRQKHHGNRWSRRSNLCLVCSSVGRGTESSPPYTSKYPCLHAPVTVSWNMRKVQKLMQSYLRKTERQLDNNVEKCHIYRIPKDQYNKSWQNEDIELRPSVALMIRFPLRNVYCSSILRKYSLVICE